MFLDFYALKEQPFGVTPDPRYLFLSASHREALASLFYGVQTGRGLMALIAPPGMGKTTLLFHFLEHLKRSARTAYLFQTQCDSFGLLRYLLGDLRIDTRGEDFVAMHEKLNEALLREAKLGRRFVLVIDEAQNLDDAVLETARLLSDFETPREKLLQIVFAGQSQLAEKLERPELTQLRQRIAILSRLESLCASDTNRYIEHRLRVAGYKGAPLFTPAAMNGIAACTQGIPRNINNVCFSALSLGCALGVKPIDADLVVEAAADLDIGPIAHERQSKLLPVVVPVSPGPTAPANDPEMVVSPEVVKAGLSGELCKQADFEQAKSEPLDGLPTILVRFEGAGSSDVIEVELIGLEDFVLASEAPNASLKSSPQPPLDPGECAVSDPQAEFWNGSLAIPDSRESVQQFAEAPTECGSGVCAQSRGDSDRTFTNVFHQTQTVFAKTDDPRHQIGPKGLLPMKKPFLRTAVAAALVLAFTTATSFRQDIRIAEAGFSLYLNEIKGTPASAKSEQPLRENTKAMVAEVRQSAQTTSEIVVRPLVQARLLVKTPKEAGKSIEVGSNGETVIVVQPGDDLRQICLRHFGFYNESLLNRVSRLNPELTDPDRIEIGQRIVLPNLGEGNSNDPVSFVRTIP